MVLAPLIVLCGPTAVGKTAASIELAERLHGEIIAADSRTVYRQMNIGTAKPTPQQRERVPHHLLDIADPDQVVTVAGYRRIASETIWQVRGRNKIPIMTGGTGLYIRAVVDGFTIPEVPPDDALRLRLEESERRNPGILHARLREVDPVAAGRIHPRNVRRLIRALEVHEHTGQPISALQRSGDAVGPVVQFGLTTDRATLYERIDTRVDEQIAAGLVDEVRQLLAKGYDTALPSMQSLGYKEIVVYLRGKIHLEEAIRLLKRNTRRFAKRQFTWFRRDDRIRWLDVSRLTAAHVADQIVGVLQWESERP